MRTTNRLLFHTVIAIDTAQLTRQYIAYASYTTKTNTNPPSARAVLTRELARGDQLHN